MRRSGICAGLATLCVAGSLLGNGGAAWAGPPILVCDFDGVCEPMAMESCSTCPDDCGTCSGGSCGDGVCDASAESCLTCPTDCPCTGTCGDGMCDPGEIMSCPIDCGTTGVCGNGLIEPGEECDDGNLTDGDGCSSFCTWEVITPCGDGICSSSESCFSCPVDCGCMGGCGDGGCDPAAGESCTTCSLDCGPCGGAICGNAIVETGEQCDPPNGTTCDAYCQLIGGGAVCGDGTADPGEDCDGADLAGETCASQGFDAGTLACDTSCAFDTSGCTTTGGSYCGDGTIDTGEQCDDGNGNSGDGCSASCNLEPVCGNGIVEFGEDCDGTPDCSAACAFLPDDDQPGGCHCANAVVSPRDRVPFGPAALAGTLALLAVLLARRRRR